MALNKGKHIVKEIDSVLCTVVETGISSERMNFLKKLLEFNKFEVKTEEEKNMADTNATDDVETKTVTITAYTLGVTDLVFNPMIAVYEKSLKRPDGEIVSPNYWNQLPETPGLPYFEYRQKNPDAVNEDEFIPVSHNYSTVH